MRRSEPRDYLIHPLDCKHCSPTKTIKSLFDLAVMLSPYLEDARPLWSYGLLAIGLYSCLLLRLCFFQPKIPLVGVRSRFEAGIVSNYRFYKDAETVLLEGYAKVRTACHNQIFRLTHT